MHMTPETVFKLVNWLALTGWIMLIVLPRRHANKLVIGIVTTLLAALYSWLVFEHFKPAHLQNFQSLQGISALFENPHMLLAGWVHYLAFDLMVGAWIKNDAYILRIHFGFVLPCLVFTFLLGPLGLLLYLIIRSLTTKRYFTENY
jgi:hypothetical protein